MQAGLSAMGSGQTVVSRATIKLAQPASVRLYLTVSDASGSRKLLLAESVVRISNQPMLIQGINPIAWQGNLASARFYLEVGQLAEGVFPDYTLDNLFIERDSDADGLSDSEETALGTDPTKTDTDNDGMPDGWELANGFNPLVNDAGLDSDGDGFTNLQEYGAATNPKDASSYPGKPINAKLDVRAREVLKYLALLPSQANNRVIAGQHVSDAAAHDIQGYDYNITALARDRQEAGHGRTAVRRNDSRHSVPNCRSELGGRICLEARQACRNQMESVYPVEQQVLQRYSEFSTGRYRGHAGAKLARQSAGHGDVQRLSRYGRGRT
jgi:hypothetical protein